MSRNFIDILPIYKDKKIESENYYVITEKFNGYPDEKTQNVWGHLTENREYVIMVDRHTKKGMMSDHPTETSSNQKFLDSANGEVLIFGLGLGYILFPLLSESAITKIKVVEIDLAWINSILPIIKPFDSRGILEVVHGDANTYYENLTNSREKFDCIYFDIWQDVNEDALKEIAYFHSVYLMFLREPTSYMDSWLSEKRKVWDRSLSKNSFS